MGNREYDPINMGFNTAGCDVTDPKDKHRFIVEPLGNHNTGHEYGTKDIFDKEGNKTQSKLTEQERWDLIEYIKTL